MQHPPRSQAFDLSLREQGEVGKSRFTPLSDRTFGVFFGTTLRQNL